MIKKIHINGMDVNVSSDGRIYRPELLLKNGRVLPEKELSQAYSNEYPQVTLYNPITKNSKAVRTHRLVAMAFLGDWDGSMCVDHIDGCKTNNRSENLRMVTRAENIRYYWGSQREQLGLPQSKKKRREIELLVKLPPNGFYGVSKHKNKFIAQIRAGKARISGGMFYEKLDAACAANKIMIENGFPLSRINVPLECSRITSFEASKMRLSRSFAEEM